MCTLLVYNDGNHTMGILLNQARAGHRLARAWFLKIDPVRIVSMHVCVCLRACMRACVHACVGVCVHTQGY